MAYLNEETKSKENLVRSLGIFELRGLARELGVKSPTTKKREELVDLILEIVSSGEEPMSAGKRKGRPFKKLSSISQITSSVTTSWLDENFKPSYENVMCFAQTMPDFDALLQGNEKLCGYVREVNGLYSFFDYQNKARIFIKNDILNSDKLTNGDFVVVNASPLREKGQYVADEILSINDIDADAYENCRVNNGEVIISKEKMVVDGKTIVLGRRNIFAMKEDVYENDFLEDLALTCKENKIKLVVLALNTSYENMIMFKTVKDCCKFASEAGSDARYNLDNFIDAINCVNNCIERGENVLLFAVDIMHCLKAVEDCFEKGNKEISENTDILLHKLMSGAKSFENGENSTVLFSYYDLDVRSDYFVDKIFKLCKNCE